MEKSIIQNKNRTIEILFPLSLLKDSPELLKPNNTDSIYEYYLLENLSCGLVRDSKESPTGYIGCVADRYYQSEAKTWVFHIRELQWSSGRPVTALEISRWIEALCTSSKRHIKYLKFANEISFDEKTRELTIRFPFEMDTTILHELSLADAALTPNEFATRGWGETVGPYVVKEWSGKENKLMLSANKYSPCYHEDMPQLAHLFSLTNPSDRARLFKDIKVDVVPLHSIASPRMASTLLSNAPQVFRSHPIAISFFYFNFENAETRNIERRIEFASVINEFRPFVEELTRHESPLKMETQMVPEGFKGRIPTEDEPTLLQSEPTGSKTSHLKIKVSTSLKDFELLFAGLRERFSQQGIELEINFSDSSGFEKDEFAKIYTFLGNSLDPSGSWVFLAGSPDGLMRLWHSEFNDTYKKAFQSNSILNREKNLGLLHREILQKAIAVPFAVGQQRYLLSSYVDASKWNPFNSRLRIYDLKWK